MTSCIIAVLFAWSLFGDAKPSDAKPTEADAAKDAGDSGSAKS